jgi:Fe-S cluster assembly protein SufD
MNARLSPLEVFRSEGVPHRRIEAWKYSDLHAIVGPDEVAGAGAAHWHLDDLPPGVELAVLGPGEPPVWATERLRDLVLHGAMDAAARAFAGKGVALRVPRDLAVESPIRLAWRGHGHAQIILVVEHGASVTVSETHHTSEGGLRNVAFSAFVADGARLTHVRQAARAPSLASVETISVDVQGNGRYGVHLVELGARLSRVEFDVLLAGEGAQAEFSGAIAVDDGGHVDVTTHVDHAIGRTRSVQLFKAVAAGKSRAVYQGRITVREGANGSDSRQTAKALLLNDRAEADLKPELEIFADDVKCAHGAAVGDLDADSLFYLRSRGVPEAEARNLLVRAFLEEPMMQIEHDDIRNALGAFLEGGLKDMAEAQP